MYWGISPALDLQEHYKCCSTEPDELDILLIGGCDARHILKTLAQSHRYKKKKINIFILEGCLELISRQLMLLSIALENPNTLGLLEKTRLFMEIYGNTLLRPQSSKYMISKARQLIKMVTDTDYMSKIIPNVTLSVKYRERDYMEMLFQFWKSGHMNIFSICELWDKRVRQYLGTRYDAKSGVFDWDYNMRLKDIGGNIITSQEYQHFRNSGMSFTWLDVEVSRPNNTLAAGVVTVADDFCHRGYVGDIITGPYVAYGLNCEDEIMMKKSNSRYLKRSTDITERNVMRMLYELEHNKRFDPELTKGLPNYNLGTATIVQQDAKISMEHDIENNLKSNIPELPSLALEDINIIFLSPTAFNTLPLQDDFKRKFDIMFASHGFVNKITTEILDMVKDDGLLIMENRLFLVDNRKNDIKEFAKKFDEICNEFGCKIIEDFDPLQNSYVKMKFCRSES